MKLANSFVFEQPQALQNVVRFGYFVLEDSLFDQVTAALWSRIIPEVAAVTSDPDLSTLKPEQLWPQLAPLEPSVYPLRPGPPVIVEGSAVVVDLWAATTQLRSLLQFPAVQGVEANARARHFEDAVQELLDSSPWRPEGSLRRLRGIGLEVKGQEIGEIDAVGSRDGVALLVSCKSRVCGDNYDAGDYREGRNAATTVIDAVEKY